MSDNPESALARFRNHLEADEQTIEAGQSPPPISDPWEVLLKNLEASPNAGNNIVQAVDADGRLEWRVRSCYLLANVASALGIAPERINAVHHRRLGAAIRKLGWTGPKNLRFGREQAKGYFKAAEDLPALPLPGEL